MYETVLVPTDGSDQSFRAAEEAIDLTAKDGTIHVLSVVEELPLFKQSGEGAKLPEKDRTAEREYLEEATQRIEELADTAGIDCESLVVEGVPYHEILTYAEEIDADAIVLGKRGSGLAAKDMLGSTTERVVRRASTTVISVPQA